MKNMPRCVRFVMAVVLAAAGTVACSTAGTHDTPTVGVKQGDSVLAAVDPAHGADATTLGGAIPDIYTCYGYGDACENVLGGTPCCANEACDWVIRGEPGLHCGCATGYTACEPTGGSESCVNEQTDPDNCGSCGHVCTGGELCCGGECDSINLSCGSCGNSCLSGENCVSGACQVPSDWLYTSGNTILKSTGTGHSSWMGRGVNIDDVFLGGHNYDLTTVPDAGGALDTLVATLITQWKPNFLRVSLSMYSSAYTQVTWLDAGGMYPEYKTQMTEVINYIASRGLYVDVTLRSDASMTNVYGEGSEIPTGATDATYQALVDSFASSPFVIFGLSNEPGGDTMEDAGAIASAMSNAVGAIRSEENRLAKPHHIVAVQGIDFTNNLAYYATHPLLNSQGVAYDNVVYEYHAYETLATPYANIPVIVGEYGPEGTVAQEAPNPGAFDAGGFYANVEGTNVYSVLIPNLAWDVEPYSGVQYDLVQVTGNSTELSLEEPWVAWGSANVDAGVVPAYLLTHLTHQ